jgi:hypothetical protein
VEALSTAVQDLMAHTDPRSYQKGHARKVLRVEMVLPYSVSDDTLGVKEIRATYQVGRVFRQEKFPENFLTRNLSVA